MPIEVVQVRFESVTFFNVISGHASILFFLLITSYGNEIEGQGWLNRVQVIQTYRLIYILTFSVTISPRSKFELELLELSFFNTSR